MSRPRKRRLVCGLPQTTAFRPVGQQPDGQPLSMSVDEYECIRLIDHLGFSQEECSRQMGVARTTVQLIYSQARVKLARMLVEGLSLVIEGGTYDLCSDFEAGCRHAPGAGCRQGRRHRHRMQRDDKI